MRRRLGTDPTYPKQLMGSRARSGWGGTICFTQGEATLPFLREESMSSLTVLKVLGRARSGKARGIRQRTRRPAPRHRGAEQSGTPRSQLIRGAPAEAPPLAPPPPASGETIAPPREGCPLGEGAERPLSGQHSLGGRGGNYGASLDPGRHSRPLRLHSRRGLRVLPQPVPSSPARPHGTALWLGSGGESG